MIECCSCRFANLGWIDDSCELFYPKHAQIGHSERSSLELVGLQLASAGLLRQFPHVFVDGPQTLCMWVYTIITSSLHHHGNNTHAPCVKQSVNSFVVSRKLCLPKACTYVCSSSVPMCLVIAPVSHMHTGTECQIYYLETSTKCTIIYSYTTESSFSHALDITHEVIRMH